MLTQYLGSRLHFIALLRDVFMQTVSFLDPNVSLSPSIFFLHDVWGFFPSLWWKMYFPSVSLINLMSFSSKPAFILFCNTGSALYGLYFSFASWFDVRLWKQECGRDKARLEEKDGSSSGFLFFSAAGNRPGWQCPGSVFWGSRLHLVAQQQVSSRQFPHPCAAGSVFLRGLPSSSGLFWVSNFLPCSLFP